MLEMGADTEYQMPKARDPMLFYIDKRKYWKR